MKININDNEKMVDIWLTKSESKDDSVKAMLKEQFAAYKQKKYTVFVFYSGTESLTEQAAALLKHNAS